MPGRGVSQPAGSTERDSRHPLVHLNVVERLLRGKFDDVGVHAPGEILDAKGVLAAHRPDHMAFEVTGA